MNGYVILLKKVLGQLSAGHDAWIPKCSEKNDHWLILGHVDEIYQYPLPRDGHFLLRQDEEQEKIHKQNSENVFYHPIFAFLEESYSNPPTTENWYVAFVRIHFAKSTNINEQFEKLATYVSKLNINVRIYRPSEFSDMLVELQGNCLSELVEVALRIKNQDVVGKTYTYFGISATYLNQDALPDDDRDLLAFFSLRFSSPSFSSRQEDKQLLENYCSAILETLHTSKKYCVTGVDDVLIRGENVCARDIVKVVKQWREQCGKGRPTIRTTTRVGYELDSFSSAIVTEPICGQLMEERKKFIEYCEQHSVPIPNWLSTASELVNAVVRMSRTPMMDEVVYLVAPGLCTFYQNLMQNPDAYISAENAHNEKFKKFIERCASLMEQLLRSEDQLSAQSEIRPAIYDIPVFMLEYTLAFLQKISSWLITPDPWKQAEFTFLPIPCLDDQVRTVRIFPTSKEIPGLVQMEFPVKYLYHPEQLLPELTHEISHHIGVYFRQRETRWDFFCRAAAIAFAQNVFHSIDKPIVDYIMKGIKEKAKNDTTSTLIQLDDKVEEWVVDTFCRVETVQEYEERYATFVRDFLLALPKEYKNYNKIVWRNDREFEYRIEIFSETLEEIHQLFSEVYADICMLHSLGYCLGDNPTRSAKDYIGHFLKAAAEHPEKTVILYTVRIYACLRALGIDLTTVCSYKFDGQHTQWERIRDEIFIILNDIENGEDSGELQYPIDVIRQLEYYAKYCYNKMRISHKGDTELRDIRRMFRSCCSPTEAFYHDAINAIDTWRQSILSRDTKGTENNAR